MAAGAAAESLVIDGKDIDSETVQTREGGDAIRKRAAGAVEIEDRCIGLGGVGGRGNPPAVKTGIAGIGDVEADVVEGEAGGGGRGADGARGMVEHLPLALVKEQAQDSVGAEGGGRQGESEGGEKPAAADGGGRHGVRRRRRGRGNA